MPLTVFRSLFSSDQIFQRYWTGRPPEPHEFELLLLVSRHQAEPLRPDGHHRNSIHDAFSPWQGQTRAGMLDQALRALADTHLEWKGDTLYVCNGQQDLFPSWQQTISEIPALPLLSYAIREKIMAKGGDEKAREALAAKVIGNSLQPSPHLPLLDDLIRREGLHELHMHLNGTTEPELVWLHTIGAPRRAFCEFMASCAQHPGSRELLLQIGLTGPMDVFHLLRLGAYLRDHLILGLVGGKTAALPVCSFRAVRDDGVAACPYQPTEEKGGKPALRCRLSATPEQCPRFWARPLTLLALQDLLRTFRYRGLFRSLLSQRESTHPLAALAPRLAGGVPVQVAEALMLGRAYDAVAKGNEAVAAWLHAYLVVQARYHRLLVQQYDQIGFDQFQKIPDNKLRDPIEEKFAQRFRQLRGMYGGDLASIEGRFSPAASTGAIGGKIKGILAGYRQTHGHGKQGFPAPIDPDLSDRTSPKLRLVAHFIKKKDPGQQPKGPARYYMLCRHHKLRFALRQQAAALAYGKERGLPQHLRAPLAGIDACASETHAPPEVFAPAFRMLRERGFPHCTFHAGEDFLHLLSGIRAVYETLEFLNLRDGDRIGHATALGIDPEVWLRLPGAGVKLGEQYDNLLFAYRLLSGEPQYDGLCRNLIDEAARLHVTLFIPGWRRGRRGRGKAGTGCADMRAGIDVCRRSSPLQAGSGCEERYRFDLQAVQAAWRLRGLDPMVACYGKLDEPPPLSAEGWREWQQARKAREENPRAFDFFMAYHFMDPERWNRIEKPSRVLQDLFKPEVFTALQGLVLKEVKRRGVLLESMPSSNVRISYYHSYEEHHILDWLGLGKDNNRRSLPRPTVAICSDDPGIFPTTLRNELCHVYQMLIKRGRSEDQAIEILRQLNRNARAYRFGVPR